MFTGIIKELGTVDNLERSGGVYKLAVRASSFDDVKTGDSVAVNGVCLTLTEKKKDFLYFDVMEETLRRSALAKASNGDRVNLEGSLKFNGTLDGHFVLGHIDCIGRIKNISKSGNEFSLEIGIPKKFNHLIVEKGSVAVDGISLTVGEVGSDSFTIYIIPHTLKITTLGMKKKGDAVNIEFDVIGKYIARAKETQEDPRITDEFLRSKGF